MIRLARLFVLAAALAAAWPGAARAAELPVVQLSAGVHLIRAEVASTQASMAQGLMFRKALGPNEGMLFVYPGVPAQSAPPCMWMRDTLIPLSVAFIDADGTIANIAEMKPHDLTSHCAVRPVPYALEMERGWFAARGLKAGARIQHLDRALKLR